MALILLVEWFFLFSGNAISFRSLKFLTGKMFVGSNPPGVSYPENVRWFEFRPGRTPVVLVVFAEVFKIKLGSIPNGADPMVEWFFLFSSEVRNW